MTRLFEDLTPPPGGLQRLRERLEREELRTRRWWAWAMVPAAVAAMVIALSVSQATPPSALFDHAASQPALLRYGFGHELTTCSRGE